METSYIVTFIGDDRPGLVEQLSATIEKNQGNWLDSRLSQLEGKFAGLIHVSLPATSGAGLESDLKALASRGLSVRVTASDSLDSTNRHKTVVLSIIGPDRPGIVREISRALAAREVNVVEMDSSVGSAPMSGEMLFEARIEAQVQPDTSLEELGDALEEIANEMTLDIDLDPS